MTASIEAAVRQRTTASPAEILDDIGATDAGDRAVASAVIVQMVDDGRLEARQLVARGVRVPVFSWCASATRGQS